MIFGSKKKAETPETVPQDDKDGKGDQATPAAAPVSAQEQAASAVASAMSGGGAGRQVSSEENTHAGSPAGQTPDGHSREEHSRKEVNPEMAAKITEVRTKLHETFGKVALAMMTVPRYRNMSLSDLGHLVLDPLMRDRVAIASPTQSAATSQDVQAGALTGIAIWASVSSEVDAKIREQIKAGTFPIRLKPEDWTSGNINWLLDVIAPSQRLTTSVIANFRQVVTEGDLRIHPIVTRLVDPEALKKMGAQPINTAGASAEGAPVGTPTH